MIKSYGNRILQHTRNRNALPCVQVSLLNMQEYSTQDKLGPVLRILNYGIFAHIVKHCDGYFSLLTTYI